MKYVCGHRFKILWVGLLLCCGLGCRGEKRVGVPPEGLASLSEVGRLVGTDSFAIASAMSIDGCDLIVVGSQWGTIVRVHADGAVEAETGRVPFGRASSQLERGVRGRVLVWSLGPAFLGSVSPDLSVASLPLQTHAWDFPLAGHVEVLGDGFAVTGFISQQNPRRAPRPWLAAPLVYVLDGQGKKRDSIGALVQEPGDFLAWHRGRVSIGVVGDTVSVLSLGDGMLSRWVSPYEAPITTAALPSYLVAPPPAEEWWQYPWIQIGGEMVNVVAISQVEDARFAEDGSLYAIRNYAATWQERRGVRQKIGGVWDVSHQGLERYSPSGALVARYGLPAEAGRWFRVGEGGRLLFGGRNRVIVARETAIQNDCPPLPESITILVADLPP